MPVLIKDLNKDLAVTDTLLCASAYTPATAYTTEDKCLNPTAANPLQGGTIRLKGSLNNQYQIITAKNLYNFYPDVVYKNFWFNPGIMIVSGSTQYPANRVSGSIEDWFWFSTSSNNSLIYPFRIHVDFYSFSASTYLYYPAEGDGYATVSWYGGVNNPGSTVGSKISETNITNHGTGGHGYKMAFSDIASIYGCSGEVTGFGRMSNPGSSFTKTNASSVVRLSMASNLTYYGDNRADYTAAKWIKTSQSLLTGTDVWNRNMRCRYLKQPDDRYDVATDLLIIDSYKFVANTGATSNYNYVLATTITRGSYNQVVQIRVETFAASTYSTLFTAANQRTNEIITLDQYADSKTQSVTIYSSTVNTSYLGIRVTPLTINTSGNVGLHNSSYLLFTPPHGGWSTSSVQNPMQFYTSCSNATSESVLMTIEVNG